MKKIYSKEKIVNILKNLSRKLGKQNLSQQEISTVIPKATVYSYFGSIGTALEAAGLEKREPNTFNKEVWEKSRLSEDELFNNLYKIEQRMGREPGYNACSSQGDYSPHPYRTRFGKWNSVLQHYRRWKIENNKENVSSSSRRLSSNGASHALVSSPPGMSKIKKPEQFYGEPIDFRGLRHVPINEQGVVFFFGMISHELGFNIEAIQQGFPDSEGKFLYDDKKSLWAKARIEFEYKATSFKKHGHSLEHCDFIVCWINDWEDCPINVIELKTEILKLPSKI